jgi:hypothetical protein
MFFYLSGISSCTVCAPAGLPDGGAGGIWFVGGGGGGGCGRREVGAFGFFGGATEAAAIYGRLFDGAFLLGATHALPVACADAICAAAAPMCSVPRGGTKSARAAAVVLPASVPPLGFGALGGGATNAAAAAEGGTE